MTSFRIALLALLFASTPSHALLISVTGTPGSGTTTWTFSGSSTVGVDTIRIDDDDSSISWGWIVGAAFYSGTNSNIDFSGGDAKLAASGITYDILGIGAENSSPDELFGIAIDDASASSSSYNFQVGETLDFSGAAIAAVDITEFASGTTSATEWATSSTGILGALPVTFQVEAATTSLPVASSLSLLAFAGFIPALLRRRAG